ncbi:peptidylprolyl isomerase [Geminicoccaceae bacterium 1502E]|nr:peptidylprolyl isomerase [Geminicoccaceae bacterium 1502E]
MRRLLLPAAALMAAFAFADSFAAETGEANPVVAKVDGQEVTRSDIEAAHRNLPDQYRQMPLEMLYEPLLNQVIDSRLLLREAEERKLEENPEVQAALQQARQDVLRDQLLQQAIEDGVTEERLKEAYEALRAAPDFAFEEVKARHILVETEEEAKEIIKSLGEGADFDELAKEKSIDPSAKSNSGDLGYFRREAMVGPFAEAAFAIEPGATGEEPVQTQFGWHVIRVDDKRETVPSFAEKEPELRDQLAREIAVGLLEEVREGAEIERFNLDGSPRTE